MANPHKAEIEAEIGGVLRRLRLAANELVELQHFLGKGPIALLRSGELDYRETVVVIHFGLQGGGLKQEFRKTLTLVDGMKVSDMIDIALKLVRLGLGFKATVAEEEAENAEGNAHAPGANGSTTSPGAA